MRLCYVCLCTEHHGTSYRIKKKCRYCSSLHNELLCVSVRNTEGFIVEETNENLDDNIGDGLQEVELDEEVSDREELEGVDDFQEVEGVDEDGFEIGDDNFTMT